MEIFRMLLGVSIVTESGTYGCFKIKDVEYPS